MYLPGLRVVSFVIAVLGLSVAEGVEKGAFVSRSVTVEGLTDSGVGIVEDLNGIPCVEDVVTSDACILIVVFSASVEVATNIYVGLLVVPTSFVDNCVTNSGVGIVEDLDGIPCVEDVVTSDACILAVAFSASVEVVTDIYVGLLVVPTSFVDNCVTNSGVGIVEDLNGIPCVEDVVASDACILVVAFSASVEVATNIYVGLLVVPTSFVDNCVTNSGVGIVEDFNGIPCVGDVVSWRFAMFVVVSWIRFKGVANSAACNTVVKSATVTQHLSLNQINAHLGILHFHGIYSFINGRCIVLTCGTCEWISLE